MRRLPLYPEFLFLLVFRNVWISFIFCRRISIDTEIIANGTYLNQTFGLTCVEARHGFTTVLCKAQQYNRSEQLETLWVEKRFYPVSISQSLC